MFERGKKEEMFGKLQIKLVKSKEEFIFLILILKFIKTPWEIYFTS